MIASQRVESLCQQSDVDGVGMLCKVLNAIDPAMDIITLHVRIDDILIPILHFVEDFDCESVGVFHFCLALVYILSIITGDPQTALEYLGNVILFLQATLVKFQVKGGLHHLSVEPSLINQCSFLLEYSHLRGGSCRPSTYSRLLSSIECHPWAQRT